MRGRAVALMIGVEQARECFVELGPGDIQSRSLDPAVQGRLHERNGVVRPLQGQRGLSNLIIDSGVAERR